MAPKTLVLCVASILLAPTFLLAIAPAAVAALSIDAPGWDIVWPGEANATASTLFTPGDATGDGIDDILLFYPPKWDWTDPNSDFRNSFDLFAGSQEGLSQARLSHSNGTQDIYTFDQSSVRAPRDWDFNGDGLADLALSEFSFSGMPEDFSTSMKIWLGSAEGISGEPNCAKRMAGSIADSFRVVLWRAVGDINGDGPDDMVAIRQPGYDMNGSVLTTHDVRLVYGGTACTNETFRAPSFAIEAEDGGALTPLGSADFNRDGFDDLVTDEMTYTQTGTSHRLRVYPGATANLSSPGTSFELVNAVGLQFFIGPDINGDGYADLSIGAGGTSLLGGENFAFVFYRGSGQGLDTAAQQGSELQGNGLASAVASLGDFNGDGLPDMVLERSSITGETDSIRVQVFLGNGGSFELPAEWSATVQVTGVDSSFSSTVDARGDVDGDGLSDIVLLAGANLYGGGPPRNGQNTSDAAHSAILVFYGRQIVQFLSGVGPVGFDRGVAYPTYEYGFDVTARASSAAVFDRVSVITPAGNFTYYPTSNSFAFEPNTTLAPGEYARMHPTSSAVFDNATQQWDIQMRFDFTWHFPIETQVPFRLVASGPSVPPVVPQVAAGTFRVEKDIEFAGTLSVINDTSGAWLVPGQWVAGAASLHVTGLTAHFEGAPGIPVPAAEFSWMAGDDGGSSWSQGPGVAPLELAFQADASSDLSDQVAVTLSGIPNPDIRMPSAMFPYRVDADAPSFGSALPANDSWSSTHELTIAVQVIDPLTGVDPARVEVQVSTNGPGALGAWQAASIDGSNLTLASAVANASFLDGDQNYFRFRVYDAVGNGPALSDAFQVRVDTLHVVFSDATPASDQWQRSSSVVAAVTVRDLGASGVALSSVAYRTSTAGLFAHGPWTPIAGLSGDTEVRAQASVGILEGDQNFIQWRAEDIVGTGLTVSSNYRIIADSTAPAFGEVTPASDERRTAAQLEVQVNVSDGGPVGRARSGVDASTVEYSFRPAGGNASEWTAEGLVLASGVNGSWTARATVQLAEGPGNEVRFRATDFAGNGPAESVVVSYHLNRGPAVALSTNATNHTVVVGSNITLTAAVSDPDGDPVDFVWYDGSTVLAENNTAAVDLALPLGNWTFVVVARDSFGFERSENITVHIVRVPPAPPPPPPPPPPVVPRAAAGDALPWLLLVIVGGAATVYFVKRKRGPRGGEPGAPVP